MTKSITMWSTLFGVVVGLGLLFPMATNADELACDNTQIIESVLVDPGVGGQPEIVVHHDAVTHTEYRYRNTIVSSWKAWSLTDDAPNWVQSWNKQTKEVTDVEAYDEVVQEEIIGVDPTYEDQCVVNPAYTQCIVKASFEWSGTQCVEKPRGGGGPGVSIIPEEGTDMCAWVKANVPNSYCLTPRPTTFSAVVKLFQVIFYSDANGLNQVL